MQYPPLENTGVSGDTLYKMTMAYDGTGRRISKTRWVKARGDAGWSRRHVTHYTGIGTEIRENMPGGTLKDVRVVVNMPVFFRVTLTRLKPRSYIEKDILRLSNGGAILPKQSFGASRQGLGRYGVEDAADAFRGVPLDENGKPTSWSALNPKFEWYLKNHLGSTMLVYGTQWADHENLADVGAPIAAYDYRAFGEQINLVSPSSGKVTENFTGNSMQGECSENALVYFHCRAAGGCALRNERDDETGLSYHEARSLDPMLGAWISVDPKRFFSSPYLYMGNGYNPILFADLNGMKPHDPFRSRKEAAEDFARTYNDDSIRENAEYCAAIYSYMKEGQKYYSYNVPLKGDSRSAPFDNYVAPGQTFEATVHAHGAYDIDLYDPITGNDGNYLPSVMPGDYYVNFKLHNVRGPAYLSTPGGHLVEYGVDYIGILYMNVVPSSGIAADEFSPYIAPGAVDAYDGSADDPYREK